MTIQRYVFPETIKDCMRELGKHSGRARIIAGGTDLVLAIQRGDCNPIAILDITRITELEGIVEEAGEVRLGARVTHAACASSPLIQKSGTCLAEACRSVGSPQIQHVATVAGNVVNAQPAADGAIALMALGARARIVSTQGAREERVEQLYSGVGQSRVDSTRELLTDLRFPLTQAGEGTSFLRVTPPNGMGLPALNGAVWVSLREKRISDIRIALGPVSNRPFRAQGAESVLRGVRWDDADIREEAARLASEEANPRDSLLRGSAAYRRQLIKVLLKGLMEKAIERACGSC
jgi:CO/xanthine dehydrogenase FAD-binding subunit